MPPQASRLSGLLLMGALAVSIALEWPGGTVAAEGADKFSRELGRSVFEQDSFVIGGNSAQLFDQVPSARLPGG